MSHVAEIACGKPLPSPVRQADARVALDLVTDSVLFFFNPTTSLVNVNRAACRHLGYSRRQLCRMSLADIAPRAIRGSLADQIDRVIRGQLQEARVQTVYRHQNGALLPVQCSIRALEKRPASLLVAVARDFKDPDENSEPCLETMFRDPLTGLPNRAWLLQQLEQDAERAEHSNYRFAVLFIDVDRFKAVNDSFGHLAGDHVLQAVTRRLTASVRPGDVVARYGGDEFVVLMRDVHSAKAIGRIARRIGRRVIAGGTHCEGKPWRARVTVSIGVSISEGPGLSALFTVDRADRAMYQAKALGRNGRFVMDEWSKSRRG